jgi:hypothetical protein
MNQKNVPLWASFFENPGVTAVLHVINAIGDRLDAEFMQLHRDAKLRVLKGSHGGHLSHNPSSWPGIALHWNQLPGDFHWDARSLFSGWDVVNPWGPFTDCILVFPDLHIYIKLGRGEVVFLRGAALRHGVKEWKGQGRMVMVPFVDRRLFGDMQIRRPRTFRRLYGKLHGHLRTLFPSTPLQEFLTK